MPWCGVRSEDGCRWVGDVLVYWRVKGAGGVEGLSRQWQTDGAHMRDALGGLDQTKEGPLPAHPTHCTGLDVALP